MANTIDTSTYNGISTEAAAAARSKKKDYSESMGFNDYISLMVAQLQNQDMYNSADTTQMTEQLAQYSLVTAADEIISMQSQNYAASLIGKNVSVSYAGNTGAAVTDEGIVTGITIKDGQPLIYVNGSAYNLSEIEFVGTTEPVKEEPAAEEVTEEAEAVEAAETPAADEVAEEAEIAEAAETPAADEEAIENGLAADTENLV